MLDFFDCVQNFCASIVHLISPVRKMRLHLGLLSLISLPIFSWKHLLLVGCFILYLSKIVQTVSNFC